MQILKIVFHLPYRIFFFLSQACAQPMAFSLSKFKFRAAGLGAYDNHSIWVLQTACPPPRDGVTLAIATGNRFQRGAPGPGLLGPKVQSGLRLSYGTPAEARPFVPLQSLLVTFLCPIHRRGHSENPGFIIHNRGQVS